MDDYMMICLIQSRAFIYDVNVYDPSDTITVKFVTDYYKKNHSMPTFVRKSWKPVQRIIEIN